RAAAYVGRAEVAARTGDAPGAGAHVAAALDELLRGKRAGVRTTRDEHRLVDEIAARAAALARAGELAARIGEVPAPGALPDIARAALLGAEQGQGGAAADAEIEGALERALALEPESAFVSLRLALRLSRRRYRDPQA